MSLEEYLGDWYPILDEKILLSTLNRCAFLYKQKECTPSFKEIFKAFHLCTRKNCKVVIAGQDPYPQKGIATGLAFANNKDQHEMSPSLNIIKNAIIPLESSDILCNFDPTLESIASQGVLWLNTSLTTEVDKPGKHVLEWFNFTRMFFQNFGQYETGIIYVFLGKQASQFKIYVNASCNDIIECGHPSHYARTKSNMPRVFDTVNNLLFLKYGETIKWYNKL